MLKQIINANLFEKIIVVPAGDPWQKKPNASAQERLEMTKLALADLPVIVSDIEVQRSGASYAIETLHELKMSFPKVRFTWIIGSDVLNSLGSWHKFTELAQEVEFLVVRRPNSQLEQSKVAKIVRYSELEIAALDISATKVREELANHKDVSKLIPASVAGFIKSKGLYGAA